MSTEVKMPTFGYAPNQFTLHNASPEPRTLRWAARQFTLPPVDVVGREPAKYENGDPIPGTFVLTDTWVPDRDGEVPTTDAPPNWSAFTAIRNVLGVDERTGKMNGVAAQAGVSFLPNNPTPELVAQVREDGARRYAASRIVWAQHKVSAYMEAVGKARQANAVAPPPDEDYRRAVTILKAHEADIEKTLRDAPSEESADAEIEFLAFAKAKAMELAEKQTRPGLDKTQLAEELAKDPDFLNALRKQGFRVRKVGHLDPVEDAVE